MTGDSTAPNNEVLSADASPRAEGSQRPHPLDDDHDDWAPPVRTILTIRNAAAAALTVFTSTILGVGIGLPSSVPAMIGVWVATAILFGPLWYALFHQNYAERFRGPGQDSPKSEPVSPKPSGNSGEPSVFVAPPVDNGATPFGEPNSGAAPDAGSSISASSMSGSSIAASSIVASSGGELQHESSGENPIAAMTQRVAELQPSATPLPSYYQPMNQFRATEDGEKFSASSYGVIILFAVFAAAVVLASPFLAAVIVRVFG